MGNMRAPLSHEEEVTLRRIALGSASLQRLRMTDVRRLRHLMLIEGEGENCRLTALGRQRFNKLPRPTPHTRHKAVSSYGLSGASIPFMTPFKLLHEVGSGGSQDNRPAQARL